LATFKSIGENSCIFFTKFVYLYLVCFTHIIDMRKNEKTSNNTNTLKNKKIEQKSNTRKSISSQEDEIEKNIVIRRSTGREEKLIQIG
jgi:hypothetical protein